MKISNFTSRLFKGFASLAVAIVALGSAQTSEAVSIGYSSISGSTISFDGAGNFSFSPTANNFEIDSGTAVGLLGEITGTYTIGTITVAGPISSAPVTGTGSIVIHDGAFDFTATLNWVDVLQIGTSGTLNVLGVANMSGITYGGSNPDLLALVGAPSVNNTLTFQFSPARTLTQLATQANSTTFSGTISTPEGGATLALLGGVLLGVGLIRRKLK